MSFDPETLELEGDELVHGRYERLLPDARGDLPIARLGLAARVWEGPYQGERGAWLRFVDARGELLPLGMELASAAEARADAETARAEAVRVRAEAAEHRLAEIEAASRKR